MSVANKSVELQLQVRHQTEELQDFMRELDGWEKDIKKKDDELRRQSGQAPALDPVGNRGVDSPAPPSMIPPPDPSLLDPTP
ncbi:hypothetical protein chiPu_0027175 [Chiloscyllium punctatum]|uniref:Uncharacterized protein n=1 Tax=Chiloscyllium punctatum TaxID=137246 RepID=A0A401TK49_CHIPU|nr:hypothetical protein [Chiloscyllium punctatum]